MKFTIKIMAMFNKFLVTFIPCSQRFPKTTPGPLRYRVNVLINTTKMVTIAKQVRQTKINLSTLDFIIIPISNKNDVAWIL